MALQFDDERVTQIFTDNNAQHLISYYGKRTEELLKFATQFVNICCAYIGAESPMHVTNAAMNDCLLRHSEWAPHTSGGTRSITKKFETNSLILAHQCQQMIWFNNASSSDQRKKEIMKAVRNEGYDEFDAFFKGNSSYFSCIYHVHFSLLNNIKMNKTTQLIMANIFIQRKSNDHLQLSLKHLIYL